VPTGLGDVSARAHLDESLTPHTGRASRMCTGW